MGVRRTLFPSSALAGEGGSRGGNPSASREEGYETFMGGPSPTESFVNNTTRLES